MACIYIRYIDRHRVRTAHRETLCLHCFFVAGAESLVKAGGFNLSQELHEHLESAVSTLAHHCYTERRSRLVVAVGADRLAFSGTGQTTYRVHSYERCVTLNTREGLKHVLCFWAQQSVLTVAQLLRVRDKRPRTDKDRHRLLRRTVPLTVRLTDGGRVFGAGSRPLLVKMVGQSPSCKESRADKLMQNHLRDRGTCPVSFMCREFQRQGRDRKRTVQRKADPLGLYLIWIQLI